VAFYTATSAAEGLSPVYRFRNKTNGSYVYTIFEEEYQSLLANYSAIFVLEWVSWYACQSAAAGYTPLYRFRNKTNGTYFLVHTNLKKIPSWLVTRRYLSLRGCRIM
jgi:lysyl endopeptidase